MPLHCANLILSGGKRWPRRYSRRSLYRQIQSWPKCFDPPWASTGTAVRGCIGASFAAAAVAGTADQNHTQSTGSSQNNNPCLFQTLTRDRRLWFLSMV